MKRTWTVDERIDAMEAKRLIAPPFTLHERDLARRTAEACYFYWALTELSGRCPDGGTALLCVDAGIERVKAYRRQQEGHSCQANASHDRKLM